MSELALTIAARDVLAERRRQIQSEGWTTEHDDQHTGGELSLAAAAYATAAAMNSTEMTVSWPWAVAWWNPSTQRRNLIKAAALLLAEIERLDRQSAQR